jgi:hypothetical protein
MSEAIWPQWSSHFCLPASAPQVCGEILSGQATRLARWARGRARPFCFGTVMLRNVSFGMRRQMPVRSGESG